jgi:hypothetical protein
VQEEIKVLSFRFLKGFRTKELFLTVLNPGLVHARQVLYH